MDPRTELPTEHCLNCGGGELKIIATILERPVVEEILTQETYLSAVGQAARHHRCSPALLSDEQVQVNLLYPLQERQRSRSTVNIASCAMRFLVCDVLGQDQRRAQIPMGRNPLRLPEVLSRAEVAAHENDRLAGVGVHDTALGAAPFTSQNAKRRSQNRSFWSRITECCNWADAQGRCAGCVATGSELA